MGELKRVLYLNLSSPLLLRNITADVLARVEIDTILHNKSNDFFARCSEERGGFREQVNHRTYLGF